MQNWNQWQLPAGAVTTTVPQPPVGYPAAGMDPTAMMQAYMQYYNQPAPSGYTAEQWAAAQQQSWSQWQQWQQQYQQWQAQYGEKYQETMKQLSAAGMSLPGQATLIPPPLPKEESAKPPLPPNTTTAYQFTNMPPPHQNNLPLFPAKQSQSSTQINMSNYPQNPPLPTSQPPLPPDNTQIQENISTGKRASSSVCESSSAKKLKAEDEELTEAEKTFDAQFKQWEEQFNKWKQQNANHPDKTQYKQYEAKWTSWREKLIERREQMRRKREQQKLAAMKADAEKGKDLPGGDKILNILTSQENQGLINNLLGIGKTLGLTGNRNQESSAHPPLSVPPPPPPETAASNSQTVTPGGMAQVAGQTTGQATGIGLPSTMAGTNQASWAAQQWAAQYNAGMNMSNFPNYQAPSTMPPLNSAPPNSGPPNQILRPNFSQPPPTIASSMPNFSQPPPGFPASNSSFTHSPNVRPTQGNNAGSFGPGANERSGPDTNRYGPNDRANRSNNFGMDDPGGSKAPYGPGSDYYGRDGQKREVTDQQGNFFRPNDSFESRNEHFGRDRDGLNDKKDLENFKKEDGFNSGGDRFSQRTDRFGPGNERFGAGNNRFGQGNDRFGSGNDRFGTDNDRYAPGKDRFAPNDCFAPTNDRFGPGSDRFASNDRLGPGNDRFGPGGDRFGQDNDRFGSRNERFGNDHFDANNDRFGSGNNFRNNFDKKEMDNRRDAFSINPRGFNRNNQFESNNELAPELKKLMEKRKAAMDVFKPSFMDSEKSSNVGSLSESFKKIAGDSPFAPRGSNDMNFRDYPGPKGNSNFSPRGSGITGPSGFSPGTSRSGRPDFKPGFSDFKPRGLDFETRDSGVKLDRDVDNRTSVDNFNKNARDEVPANAGNNLHKDQQGNSMKNNDTVKDTGDTFIKDDISFNAQGCVDFNKKSDSDFDIRPVAQQPLNFVSEPPPSLIGSVNSNLSNNANDTMDKSQDPSKEEANNVANKTHASENESRKDVSSESVNQREQPLERPPWMDTSFPGGNSQSAQHGPATKNEDSNSNSILNSSEQNVNSDNTGRTADSEKKERELVEQPKKPECLPFMGENDPKPEDLNMEPPPELPNLGPVPAEIPNEPSTFGSHGPFGPRGMPFRPGGPAPFGPRGPNDGKFPPLASGESNAPPHLNSFRPLGAQFGPCGPNEAPFGPRGLTEGQFGPRGPNNPQFGPRGPSDAHFGPRGPNDGQFGPRGPNERPFGPGRFDGGQFGPRGFPDGPFGPRGPPDRFALHRRNDGPFAPRGPNNGPTGLHGFDVGLRPPNNPPFRPQNENDRQAPFAPNRPDGPFGIRPPIGARGPGDFRPRGPFDIGSDGRTGIPSLMSLKMDPAKRDGVLDRPTGMDSPNRPLSDQPPPYRPGETPPTNWKPPFSQNSFGDVDQRSGQGRNMLGEHPLGPNEPLNPNEMSSMQNRPVPTGKPDNLEQGGVGPMKDIRPGFGDCPSDGGMPYRRRPVTNRPARNNEFHIERQFNYNHGGAPIDKKCIDYVPAKVIDYAHVSRRTFQDYLMPAECFDYGHGNLKPVLPHNEEHPQKDFRNWEESEQNLKDYTEKMKVYESSVKPDSKYHRSEVNWPVEEERHGRRRKQRTKEQARDYENRTRERSLNNDYEDRFESNRKDDKDRGREKSNKSQRDNSKENDKDEDRSKGNVNWQENANKNVIETKLQDTRVSDKPCDVVDTTPKTLELPKTPNYTMVDDLLCPPGRLNRPPKIAIILRGPPGSGKSFVAKLIKDKEVEQGGSAPRILSLDDYFLVEKERETQDDNGKKITIKEMVYEYEEAMEQSYTASLVKAFKKNITDGFFNFIIFDCINEKISDYEELWSFAKTKGFKVYVCEMEMDVQICLKRNIHNRSEDEINRIVDYFEPTPGHHQMLDVNSMLQEQAIEEVQMEDSQETQEEVPPPNEDSQNSQNSQDSQEDTQDSVGISKWERMEAEDKLDRLDGLAKRKNEGKPQTMEDFLQVPDYYNMEDTTGKKRVRWADLEERKEQEKMRAVGFVVGHTNWDRMMDPTKGGSALTRTKYI